MAEERKTYNVVISFDIDNVLDEKGARDAVFDFLEDTTFLYEHATFIQTLDIRRTNKPDFRFKIGDQVRVNKGAWDEQIESMEEPMKVYKVSAIKEVDEEGSTGQHVKLQDGVRLVNNNDGTVDVFDGWIDKAWLAYLG